ncbi:MAG TPA: radical SAM protein, partial [Clostridiales bacterium]|nr:radical SAM protein [Clostridiales bacterium]
ETKNILKWISENLPKTVYISLMSQYTPVYKAENYKELNRHIRKSEYETIIDYFFDIGLENGYVQELSSADTIYTPVFDLKGI